MITVFSGFAVVILVIAAGFLAGRSSLFGPQAVYTLTMVVFWIALPATLVVLLARMDLADILGLNLRAVALSTLGAGAIGYAGYRILRPRLSGGPQPTRSDALIAMLACSYCNGSNLGIPLAVHLLHDATLTLPVILFQVGVYGPLSILLLDLAGRRQGSGPHGHLLREVILSVLRNPLIIAAALGIALSWARTRYGFTLPSVLAEPLEILAATTVGLALLAFGMSMAQVSVFDSAAPRRSILAASLVKTIIHPALAAALGLAWGASGPLLLAITLVAALPTGQNVFTYAQRFRTNLVLARDTAVISTLLSIPIMALIVLIFALSGTPLPSA